MNWPVFIVGVESVLLFAVVVVLALRWLDRRDARYPHEQGDTEDFR